MNSDEHDELWHLLGKAKQVQPSKFLARNVLREIRAQQQQEPTGIGQYLRRFLPSRKLVAATCGLASVLLLVNGLRIQPLQDSQSTLANNADYEVIAHLDELLASQETALWTDYSIE